MKWFQHHSDSHTNLKLRNVLRGHGAEAYGVFWICCEFIAQQGRDFAISKEKRWTIYVADVAKLEMDDLKDILLSLAESNVIDFPEYKKGNLYIPKMSQYSDDYTKRNQRLFGEDTDNVRTTTDNVPLDKKRVHKIRVEDIYGQKSFIEFWNIYPKRVAKSKAAEMWGRINPSKELGKKINESVVAYAKTDQWKSENGRYILNPATFLFQKRWEDEVTSTPQKIKSYGT